MTRAQPSLCVSESHYIYICITSYIVAGKIMMVFLKIRQILPATFLPVTSLLVFFENLLYLTCNIMKFHKIFLQEFGFVRGFNYVNLNVCKTTIAQIPCKVYN